MQLSTDFPDVHIVAWFSYDGDTLKKVSAYKKYGEAKFNADRGNGWIIKAGEML